MMLSRSQTPGPRPRPPAKMKRQSSLSGLRLSTTGGRQVSLTSTGSVSPSTSSPPPAYGSSYELSLPEDDSMDKQISDTLLGSPIPTTFKLMGYRHRGMKDQFFGEGGESDEWMSQSKEELAELLVKAEDIIKERENELDVTSSAVKSLYRENITLKTKHEALLARVPSSGPDSNTSSPDRVISRANSFGYDPESPLAARGGSSPSPLAPPPHYRGHVRNKVSMSTADISLLADQNAELMHKLEQLESESTSADHAGRRELKRLEKEITMLREALEKTQAKSQELEEKTKGLDKGIDKAVEEVWKKKKEREQRIKAMRNSRIIEEEHQVRDFAPKGSTFGGPSKHHPLSKSFGGKQSVQLEVEDEGDSFSSIEAEVMEPPPPQPKPEFELISQLLQKVKELEETNSRILQQQAETANQLQAVQRDTEHINKVYECLGDPQQVEVELAEDPPLSGLPNHVLASSTGSTKFGSFRRRIEAQMVEKDSIRLKAPVAKSRKSLAGLFGDRLETPSSQTLPDVPFNSWWSEGRHRSSLSMGSASIASPALSSLDFTSPHNEVLAELSPIGTRLSLESELQHFQGEMHSWESEQQRSSWHLRSQSLSNLSQISVPSSPSPLAPSFSTASTDKNKTPLASDFPSAQVNVFPSLPPLPRTPSPQPMPGTFAPAMGAQPGLNVEPPTPSKHDLDQQQPIFQREETAAESLNHLQATRSPRHEFISERIRARKARWEDGRFGSVSSTASVWGSPAPGERRVMFEPVFVPPQFPNASSTSINSFVSATSSSVSVSPMRISTIVDTLVDQFQGVGEDEALDSEYEDAADYVNESSFEETEDDEYDEEGDGLEYDDEDTMVNKTPQLTQDNALQLHQAHEKTPKHRPSPKIIVNGEDVLTQQNTTKNAASTSKAGRWGSVLLELWLWLQFAVIIFVFLYAMARRGPKAVLADAEQRTRTRKQSLRMGR